MKLIRVSTQALVCIVICLTAIALSSSAHAQVAGPGGPYAVAGSPFTYSLSIDPDPAGGFAVNASGYGEYSKTPGSLSQIGKDIDVAGDLTVDGIVIAYDAVTVSEDPYSPTPFLFTASYHLNPGIHHILFYYGTAWGGACGPYYQCDEYVTI